MEISKVAFNAGSSQHGKARRAKVGSKCDAANHLPHFNDTLLIMINFPLLRMRMSEMIGKRVNVVHDSCFITMVRDILVESEYDILY